MLLMFFNIIYKGKKTSKMMVKYKKSAFFPMKMIGFALHS